MEGYGLFVLEMGRGVKMKRSGCAEGAELAGRLHPRRQEGTERGCLHSGRGGSVGPGSGGTAGEVAAVSRGAGGFLCTSRAAV